MTPFLDRLFRILGFASIFAVVVAASCYAMLWVYPFYNGRDALHSASDWRSALPYAGVFVLAVMLTRRPGSTWAALAIPYMIYDWWLTDRYFHGFHTANLATKLRIEWPVWFDAVVVGLGAAYAAWVLMIVLKNTLDWLNAPYATPGLQPLNRSSAE